MSKEKKIKTTYIVAGDIGGTNSRFALHAPGTSEPLLVHVYSNEEALGGGGEDPRSYHHATLKPFFEKVLAEVEGFAHMDDGAFVEGVQVVACLATAGPGEFLRDLEKRDGKRRGGWIFVYAWILNSILYLLS